MFDLQKASLWKRISAALFDFIMLGMLVIGAVTGLSSVFGYEGYVNEVTAAYEHYSAVYDVEMPLTESQFHQLPEEAQERYLEAQKALNEDADAVRAYTMAQQLPLLFVTFGVLFGVLVMEFAVPLMFGNGQTLGKKIFGVALMRVDGIKLTSLQLFVRTILGKFAVELMIPIFIFFNLYFFGSINLIGIAVLVLLAIGQIICLIMTRTWSLLHDVMAGTVAVDLASQMIFETKEAQIEYIQKHHAQEANSASY